MRNCTTADCDGSLLYDGHSECVLNMNIFIITHEVLRSFMFHFLHGRWAMYCTIHVVYILNFTFTGLLCTQNIQSCRDYIVIWRRSWSLVDSFSVCLVCILGPLGYRVFRKFQLWHLWPKPRDPHYGCYISIIQTSSRFMAPTTQCSSSNTEEDWKICAEM